jgi:hypothetical protein
MWLQLRRITLKYLDSTDLIRYLRLGEYIAETAEWKPFIYEDLSTWITAFIHHLSPFSYFSNPDSATFVSVIRSVWVPEFSGQMQLVNERNESWILALTALANVWKTFQFSPVSALTCLCLARCTVSTSLRVHYFWKPRLATLLIPRNLRASFAPQLGQSLIEAATNARDILTGTSPSPLGDTGSQESHHTAPPFERIAELLDALGGKVNSEFEPTSGEVQVGGATKRYRDWEELQKHFEAELNVLEELLST